MNTLKNNEQNEKEIKNNYVVYMHISPSDKKYIGITGDTPKNRWDSGHGYRQNPYFWNAIKKYGWKNFKHIILYSGLTQSEAKQYEIDLIKKYNSTDRKLGYNISSGGDLGDISRRKPIFMYDKETGEFIRKFESCNEAERYLGKSGSNTIGRNCGENDFHTLYGYLWRWDYKPKIETINRDYIIILFDALTYKVINSYKKIDNDIFYKGVLLKRSSIIAHCNSRDYLYQNVLCCYCKDTIDLMTTSLSNNKYMKVIYQIDKENNEIINEYSTYSEAKRATGISDLQISKVCRGKYKTAGGYKWESVGLIKGEDINKKTEYISKTYFSHGDEEY